ncbi:hypothetical protein [Pseudoalteromonas sp. OOF1S-7]|uniref:hypothetical protein n=1 Tax=Pseudoalteromonas sp. OOF1S-7 TaxID=2917757 RepID=UPI001EF6623C|nr:hypothetical protein [Pseudoalteromonas sp. OOF1S-7]MCG7535171.1 hypothetical protein [Pseudoalteromonas sp. OOF1S-7]
MKSKIELLFNYIVIVIAVAYGAMVFISLNFKLTPEQMSNPGMVIAFLISCTLNIARLKEKEASFRIHLTSLFANILTFSYAAAFAVQDPWVAKVVTTILMGLILAFSLSGALQWKKGAGSQKAYSTQH